MKSYDELKRELEEMILLAIPSAGDFTTIKMEYLEPISQRIGLDLSDSEMQGLIQKLDSKNSGFFLKESFIDAVMSILELRNQTTLFEALQVFDLNKDGKIPFEEFFYFMENFGQKLPRAELKRLMSAAPIDEDGNILIEAYANKLANQ